MKDRVLGKGQLFMSGVPLLDITDFRASTDTSNNIPPVHHVFGPITASGTVTMDSENREKLNQLMRDLAQQRMDYRNAALNEFARKFIQQCPDDIANYTLCQQPTEEGGIKFWFQRISPEQH